MPVTSCHYIIGSEYYPDSGLLLNYDDDDDNNQGYTQIKGTFRALTKDYIFRPFISDAAFRSSNVRADDLGYNLYVFNIRYLQKFTASQPIEVGLKFDEVVPNGVNGYALVLTKELVSISSDGQRQFDLL